MAWSTWQVCSLRPSGSSLASASEADIEACVGLPTHARSLRVFGDSTALLATSDGSLLRLARSLPSVDTPTLAALPPIAALLAQANGRSLLDSVEQCALYTSGGRWRLRPTR